MKNNKYFIVFLVILFSFIVPVFAQINLVPFTNRVQVVLLNEEELISKCRVYYTDYLNNNKNKLLSNNEDFYKRVNRVGNRIVEAANDLLSIQGRESRIKGFSFEFNVIDDKKIVNAWCLPGGRIVVYTGIEQFCRNDELLAVLLSHEIAHAIAWHGNERLSQEIIANKLNDVLLEYIISGRLSDFIKNYKNIFELVIDISANFGMLAYSREHEYEADIIGIYIMAHAGYDPSYAKKFWENMMRAHGNRKFQFLRTHPTNQNRINEIEKNLEKANKFFRKR